MPFVPVPSQAPKISTEFEPAGFSSMLRKNHVSAMTAEEGKRAVIEGSVGPRYSVAVCSYPSFI